MKTFILLATLVASGMFAACQHEAPTPSPAPRELPGMGGKPTPVEPSPVPTQLPTKPHTREGGETHAIVPTDAGTPLPGAETPTPTGTVNPGPSALREPPETTRRQLHSDNDLILMPSEPGDGSEVPSSVKPDAGILYDAGAPLPPVPDAGPLPNRDAGQPM